MADLETLVVKSPETDKFFSRLSEQEREAVKRIIKTTDDICTKYRGSLEDAGSAVNAFIQAGMKNAFFSVYAIGGQVTKEGARPDIDLMIVTNMFFYEGVPWGIDDEDELTYSGLIRGLGEFGFKVKARGDLPDRYNLSKNQGKVVFDLTPQQPRYRPMNVLYIRGFDSEKYRLEDESVFLAKDIDESGKPLPKVLLYNKTFTTDDLGISGALQRQKEEDERFDRALAELCKSR
ncbi:MAG: hypothetical protein NTX24_04100 [Candidatus Pacearchaeota archaeon]|nr:hypothetical protein [Candidatus Pacearchaeota archaeon]